MTDQANEAKKIIVDEDWKTQVQAEKEQAEQQTQEPMDGGTKGTEMPMPPANFQTLISMLATQAMLSLGALPNPVSGEMEVHLQQAKHFIDLLGVLEEKTKGNCSPEESDTLEHIQHELRMGFVAVQNAPVQAPPANDVP